MTVRAGRLLPFVLAFLLGLGTAGLAACGGRTNRALIPAADAGPLRDDFDAIASAVDAGDCAAVQRGLLQAQNDLGKLPAGVSSRLRARLQQGIGRLRAQAPKECAANKTTTTQTQSTETVTTPTVTQTTPTTTTPTTTTTTPTTTTTTPTTSTPTTTSGTGGAGAVTTP